MLLTVARIPSAIFGSPEACDSSGDRGILNLARREVGDIAQIDQAKCALADKTGGRDSEPKEIALFGDWATVHGNLHAVKVAVGKTGLFDGMTRFRFLTDVDIHLAGEAGGCGRSAEIAIVREKHDGFFL